MKISITQKRGRATSIQDRLNIKIDVSVTARTPNDKEKLLNIWQGLEAVNSLEETLGFIALLNEWKEKESPPSIREVGCSARV